MDVLRKRILILRWLELLLSFVWFLLTTQESPSNFAWIVLSLLCAVFCIAMNGIILFLETGTREDQCRLLSHFTEVSIFSLAVTFTVGSVVQMISLIEIAVLLQPGQYHIKSPPPCLNSLKFTVTSTVCTCLVCLLYWLDHHHTRCRITQQGLVIITPKPIYGLKLTFSFILLFLLWESEESGALSTIWFYLAAHVISGMKAATFTIPLEVSELKVKLGTICANVALTLVYGQALLVWPERVLMQCSKEVYSELCAAKETNQICAMLCYNLCSRGILFVVLTSITLLLLIYDSMVILYFQ